MVVDVKGKHIIERILKLQFHDVPHRRKSYRTSSVAYNGCGAAAVPTRVYQASLTMIFIGIYLRTTTHAHTTVETNRVVEVYPIRDYHDLNIRRIGKP